jgi:uncharacterized protein DUF6152
VLKAARYRACASRFWGPYHNLGLRAIALALRAMYHPTMKKPLLALIGGLLIAVPLFAHHGDAGRYEENVIVLTGTVVEVELVDPHSMIVIDVPNEKGQPVRWQAELGGRNALAKNFGWNKSTLKFGDKVTITGRRVKSGAPYINLTEKANVVLTDSGKEIFRTPNYEAPKK